MVYRSEQCRDFYRDVELNTGLGEEVVDAILTRMDLALKDNGFGGIEATLARTDFPRPADMEAANEFLKEQKGNIKLLAIRNGVPLDITVEGAYYEIKEK
ncbi:MAG: hypothetical protein C4K49_10795 [Candidatus Thorarchaeota archaeon]|nr:MAG: hypothetical protein C4K49_10795 [Candidatus Thorarchaeota archaeon]